MRKKTNADGQLNASRKAIIQAILEMSERGERLSFRSIAAELGMQHGGLTATMKDMEAEGDLRLPRQVVTGKIAVTAQGRRRAK